ncbi:high-potential iron-sulfur protein [Ectothiorhodospiraceae bacterium WFHF3C12]|nr:high-potential iron-sulfur protein [Ectothiorhodospiraceae bacterium WFHF3C12]
MSDKTFDPSRRNLLRAGIATAVAVPFARLALDGSAHAQDLPKLALDDPQAKALQYVHDASKAGDARQEGADCANCQLYQGGADSEWGKCSIFPGKLVNAQGWCTAWAPKAG